MSRSNRSLSSFSSFSPLLSSRSTALAAVVALVASMPALAVPDVLTYAGSLRRGSVDADGTFAVVVSLFDAADGGAPLFTQSDPSLAVTAGELIVDLGADPTNPLSADVLAGDELFLAITVDGEELSPRVALSSVPFALQARFAEDSDSVGGLSAEDISSLYTAGEGLTKTNTTFSLSTNAVTSVHIVDGSITSVDIGTGAIVSSHIGNAVVQTEHLAPGAVTGAQLGNAVVASQHLRLGAVASIHLVDDAVSSQKLAEGAVTAAHITADAVTNLAMANDSVNFNEIAAGAVRSSEISDGSIQTVDLGFGIVGSTQVADNTLTDIDLAANSVGASELQTGSVGNAELATGAVTSAKIAGGGIRVFRQPSACGAGVLSLEDTCRFPLPNCGTFNPPPQTCSCTSGGTVAVCPNTAVGRIVPE
jgi:hypothetical protein